MAFLSKKTFSSGLMKLSSGVFLALFGAFPLFAQNKGTVFAHADAIIRQEVPADTTVRKVFQLERLRAGCPKRL